MRQANRWTGRQADRTGLVCIHGEEPGVTHYVYHAVAMETFLVVKCVRTHNESVLRGDVSTPMTRVGVEAASP